MKRTIGKTINGIDYHVIYQKVGAYTYREVLIPKLTINEDNNINEENPSQNDNDIINIKSWSSRNYRII